MKRLKLFILVIGISFLPKFSNAQVIELNEKTLLENVVSGNDSSYDYKGDKPCVLLFHNSTCPFAKQIGIYLEDLSKKYKGKAYFYKVNVWKISDETMEEFEIEGIPATYFFHTTKYRLNYLGMISKDDLEKYIERMISHWESFIE